MYAKMTYGQRLFNIEYIDRYRNVNCISLGMLYAKFSKHIFILSLDLTILDCIFLCGNFAPCFGLKTISGERAKGNWTQVTKGHFLQNNSLGEQNCLFTFVVCASFVATLFCYLSSRRIHCVIRKKFLEQKNKCTAFLFSDTYIHKYLFMNI